MPAIRTVKSWQTCKLWQSSAINYGKRDASAFSMPDIYDLKAFSRFSHSHNWCEWKMRSAVGALSFLNPRSTWSCKYFPDYTNYRAILDARYSRSAIDICTYAILYVLDAKAIALLFLLKPRAHSASVNSLFLSRLALYEAGVG